MGVVVDTRPELPDGSRRLDSDQVTGREGYKGCGVGEQVNCCVYLTADGDGWECQQRTLMGRLLKHRAAAGLQRALRTLRTPEGAFPDCQKEGRQ